uniref:Succinate dehydrogenase [ubiquinone] cytochrome b small subunit n=1 Tax=Tetraselmis sp. GSL018 TaxID=582737 RepID=A0A061R8R5_9CHLO|mmetsp:Transcript_31574/g.75050  ORF Transcript_31574/g.75050 Transcript_31574/m.75050 type:complete len:119 (+) Transcript_31574:112-468(+)|eukprot:CAMPEP_0177597878 /NCGR_PEP_ID=MMETSP0419_2-20121207/11983_1 /TAXON_ID=582737 /ORGANISM="Tetraselmis sp., Strain GSL018" /LENGTH=118 /DNA_ID=CAMNT_0019090151 /DNA_START=56 /DNA_END=412 /DNA_ORIENTATION=+
MSWFFAADVAGPRVQRLYELSHKVLAVSLPAAVLSPEGSMPERVSDYACAVSIPFHSHVAMNAIITDYAPTAIMGASRLAVLGMSSVTLLGLLKMAGHGGGVSSVLKTLWQKEKTTST